ncbi:hypothetical protein RH915_11085 [Serpentinicella sp. ANB-PHB4]|uniref:putative signal transducing protein n=1 Tax=Serpentinicella sp. ANB-PHB4 TaxID=3074076 RepID=UPI002856810C|nr:hypothetical protein [Serpentinicella sp. ANB-PHB4]MDR5660034.1 hypothetical protein [Serpentinicella sp. ANB-PHB4]
MWTVVYMASTRQDADQIKNILEQEGFLVRIRPVGKKNIHGTCEVLVTESEVEEAYSILMQSGY